MPKKNSNEHHLRVFDNRSEIHLDDGVFLEFHEGSRSKGAKDRYKKIVKALEEGYLTEVIELCINKPDQLLVNKLSSAQHAFIDEIVSSVTSEYGRAILGLSFLQLSIKVIEPTQSIRLHKSNIWKEGLSMRSLDKNYITPILRKHNLIKLNADGFMMTRSLAENYPYSRFYKAQIRGARQAWLGLVEELENPTNPMNALAGLHLIISKLLNNAEEFSVLSKSAKALNLDLIKKQAPSIDITIDLIQQHWLKSTYAARIMEISMHSFIQALEEMHLLGYSLRPLSQMRSANKKHGNIGDVELLDHHLIVESWDAKYGKSYLHDELNELEDKLSFHESVEVAGFVTSEPPNMSDEIQSKIQDVTLCFGVEIQILSFRNWIYYQLNKLAITEKHDLNQVSIKWLEAYTETLALERIDIAPIDEPCQQWLESWIDILKNSQ